MEKRYSYPVIIILAMVVSVFFACNSHDHHAHDDGHDHSHEGQGVGTELTLNNGAKWKADANTNTNVETLKTILAQAAPASVEEYHATGAELQASITKMITECRMQGPDHDALHLWLEPLINTNKKLQGVASVEEGAEILSAIQAQLDKYTQYFE